MPRAETERKGMPRAEEKLNDDKLELTIEEEQLRDLDTSFILMKMLRYL